jgi:hypothetical protein
MRHFCIAFVFIFGAALSFGQVQIKLKQPPMNQLGVKDMWNLTVRNTSAKDVQVILRGTADEVKEGRLVDGKTGLFTLKANESRIISGSNIPGGGTYSWQNKKFQEAILRSGNAPSGSYTICVYAESESGAPLGQDCFQQNIALQSPSILISPVDGASIAQGQPLLFTWLTPTPSAQGTTYSIRIVEVLGNQSATDAVIKNSAVFEQKEIRSTSLQYPVSARKLVEGKKYAWQISSGELKSEAWVFTMNSQCSPDYQSKIDSVKCADSGRVRVVAHIRITPKPGLTITQVQLTAVKETSFNGANIPVNLTLPKTYPVSSNIPVEFFLSGSSCNKVAWIGYSITYMCQGTGQSTTIPCFDTVFVPCCNCTYCDQFKEFEKVAWIQDIQYNSQTNNIDLATTVQMPSNLEIKSFKAEIINFTQKVEQENQDCALCSKNSQTFGNLISGTMKTEDWNSVNGLPPMLPNSGGNSHHTLVWYSPEAKTTKLNGAEIKLSLSASPLSALACCFDVVNFCIRYSFIDKDCQSCSIVKCYQIKRNNSNKP